MLDYGNATRTALPKDLPWLYHITAYNCLHKCPPDILQSRGEKKEPVKKEVQDFYGTPKRFLRFPPHGFVFSRCRWRMYSERGGIRSFESKKDLFLSVFILFLFSLPCHQFLAKFKGFFVFFAEGKSMHCLFILPFSSSFFIEAEWSGEENTLLFY